MVAFEIEKGVLYMAIVAKPKATVREAAVKLVLAGKCLKCKQPLKPNESMRKGRCKNCSYRYLMDRLQTPKEKRPQFDARLMREGTLLEAGEIREIKREALQN